MSEEKREEPTPKAERRARERGNVWQSKDLTLSAVLLSSALAVGLGREAITARLLELVRAPLLSIGTGRAPGDAAIAMALDGMLLLAPLLGVLVVSGALASALQTGPLFAPRAIALDPGRVDPSARFFELFGRRAAASLGMTLVRLLLAGAVVLVTMREALPGILTLARQPSTAALSACVALVVALLFRVGLVMAALGIVDAVLERTLYRRSLRMSRRDVLRERREAEGDEHVRRERDRVRGEARDQDEDGAVQGARLLVLDDALAIALTYDATDEEAVPRLAAIGRGLTAERMRELADAHGIASVTDEELAAQLAIVALGHPIPERLYALVARHMHDAKPNQARA